MEGNTQLTVELEDGMGEEEMTMTLQKVLYTYIKLANGNVLFAEVHQ